MNILFNLASSLSTFVVIHLIALPTILVFKNVSAVDKLTGRQIRITITNDMGPISKDKIESMVTDTEIFKADNEIFVKKIETNNGF